MLKRMAANLARTNKIAHYSFLGLLLLLSGPAFFFELKADPDSNIRWFFNYFFAEDFSVLRETVFTQGPLAFLQYPLPIENNLSIGLIFGYLIRLVLLISIWSLVKNHQQKYLHLALVFLLCVLISGETLLPLTTLLAISFSAQFKNKKWHLLSLLLFWLIWQIRLVPGLLAGGFLAVLFLVQVLKDSKNRLFYISALIAIPLGAVAIDWIIYGNFFLERHQLLYSLIFIGETPGGAEIIPWIALGATTVLFLLLSWQTRQKGKAELAISSAILVFMALTYYASRVGPGTFLVFAKLILVTSIFLITIKGSERLWIYLNLGALSLALFFMGKSYHNLDSLPFLRLKPALSIRQLIDQKYDFKVHEKQIKALQKSTNFNGTFDVYPWAYLPYAGEAEKLKPAPILHAYLGNSPQLDRCHANHFSSPEAPQNVMLHEPFPQNGFEGLTMLGQYLPNAEPLTMRAILSNYRLINGVFVKSKPRKFQAAGSLDLATNKWFTLNLASGLYFALSNSFTDLETISYRLVNGREIKFQLNAANVPNGILVSPYLYGANLFPGYEVEAIKVESRQDVMVHFDLLRLPWQKFGPIAE